MSDTAPAAAPTEATAEATAQAAIHEAFVKAEQAAQASAAGRPNYAHIVAAWANDCLLNSPAAADTAGYNYTRAQLPELVRRLNAAE